MKGGWTNSEHGVTNPAGFWIRLAANFLDVLILGVPLTLLGYLITGGGGENLVINILSVLYSLLLPVFWQGYTIGKRIMGIRIAKVDGTQLGFGPMLLRTLVGSLVYAVTLGLAAIASAFMVGLRKDKRSVHDLIAGTYVTYEKP